MKAKGRVITGEQMLLLLERMTKLLRVLKRNELQRLIEGWDIVKTLCVSPLPLKEVRARLIFLEKSSSSHFEVGSFKELENALAVIEEFGFQAGINLIEHGSYLFNGRSNERSGTRQLILFNATKKMKISDVLRNLLVVHGCLPASLEELVAFARFLDCKNEYSIFALGDMKSLGPGRERIIPWLHRDKSTAKLTVDIVIFDDDDEFSKIPQNTGILAYSD